MDDVFAEGRQLFLVNAFDADAATACEARRVALSLRRDWRADRKSDRGHGKNAFPHRLFLLTSSTPDQRSRWQRRHGRPMHRVRHRSKKKLALSAAFFWQFLGMAELNCTTGVS
jgi:hypothetical protein